MLPFTFLFKALNQCVDDWACSTIFNDSSIQENLLLIEILNYFTSFISLTDCPSSLLSKILSFFLSLGKIFEPVSSFFSSFSCFFRFDPFCSFSKVSFSLSLV